MKGAEKDHKQNEDKIKMRPIVNAMDGPKKNVSDTFSDLLSAVIEANNDEVLCYSTEELLEAFESYNEEIEKEDKDENRYIIGSMDAVALYPSLRADKYAEIIREEVIKSKVRFENVDTFELGMYIRKHLSTKYINEKGYDKWLPTKVSKKHLKAAQKSYNEEYDPYKFTETLHYLFEEDEEHTMLNSYDKEDNIANADENPETLVENINLHVESDDKT